MPFALFAECGGKDTNFPQITQQNAIKVSINDDNWLACHRADRQIWMNYSYCAPYDDATEHSEDQIFNN